MSLTTILQIDLSIAMIIVLAIIQYIWVHKLNKKPKREQFSNYQEKSIKDTGNIQLKQMATKKFTTPFSF